MHHLCWWKFEGLTKKLPARSCNLILHVLTAGSASGQRLLASNPHITDTIIKDCNGCSFQGNKNEVSKSLVRVPSSVRLLTKDTWFSKCMSLARDFFLESTPLLVLKVFVAALDSTLFLPRIVTLHIHKSAYAMQSNFQLNIWHKVLLLFCKYTMTRH